MAKTILIVDDEQDIRFLLKEILEDEGYDVLDAAHSEEAFYKIEGQKPHLIILDIWLENSDLDGMEILSKVKKEHGDIPVLMISGHGNIEMAVKAMKLGAYEFIEKPFNTDRFLMLIERALETQQLQSENISLKEKIDIFGQYTAEDETSLKTKSLIEQAAQSNARVMLKGETGSGKTLLARMIHDNSDRASQSAAIISCAEIGESELKKELNTHKGSTVILQNVQMLSEEAQVALLSFLSTPSKTGEGDTRIISTATNEIQNHVTSGKFRQTLYDRLAVSTIKVPPLRERRKDIPPLAMHYLGKNFTKKKRPIPQFHESTLLIMKSFDWSGNVRQLKNIIENIALRFMDSDLKYIMPEHLPNEITGGMAGASKDSTSSAIPSAAKSGAGSSSNISMGAMARFLSMPMKEARASFEADYLRAQIERFDGNISKVAEFIEMDRTALHRKIKSLDLHDDQETDTIANDSASTKAAQS